MAETITRASVAEVFADLPDLAEWARELIPKNGIYGIKSAARDVLQGRVPGNGWWVSYGAGPEISGKGRATFNQHFFAIAVASWWLGFTAGYPDWKETTRVKVLRCLTWMEGGDRSVGAEAGLMGKTYKPAEWRGGDYENLYIGALTLLHMAALRDGDEEIARRTHRLLRQHAAVSRLLEVPGAWPPRSLSLGCRTGIPDEDSAQCGACVFHWLPVSEWGKSHGQELAGALATERVLGIEILRRAMDAGWIALRRPETIPELVAEIRDCGLRLPWPLHWTAGVSWYEASLGGDFPSGGERKGGVLPTVFAEGGTYGVGTPLPYPAAWHLEIGPSGLIIHRQPGGVAIPVEPEPPSPPEEPEPTKPSQPTHLYPHLAEARAKAETLHGLLIRQTLPKKLALEIRKALRQHALKELGLADEEET